MPCFMYGRIFSSSASSSMAKRYIVMGRFMMVPMREMAASTSSTTFLEQRHGSLSFPNGDIEAEMLPLSWNNFLHPLLCFAVVRSNHSERLVIISPPPPSWCWSVMDQIDWDLSLFFISGRKSNKKKDTRRIYPTWMLVAVLWMLVFSMLTERMFVQPSICLFYMGLGLRFGVA